MLLNPFWYGAAAGTDPSFASVVLLLHFDGADGASGSSAYIDSSPVHRTMSGGRLLTTTAPKFGTASLGATTGDVTASDSADWLFGAGQFTVEAWIRPTGAISGVRTIVSQWSNGATNFGWQLAFNATLLNFYYSVAGTDNPTVGSTYVPTLNQWVHLAADRDASNVLRVYADGVVIASATVSATFFDSNQLLFIGDDATLSRRFLGQIDDVRITKGVARYAGAFTPPTTAFPNA